jgi:hypothetical protein
MSDGLGRLFCPFGIPTEMGRRGSNSFRRNDGLRILRIAKDSGLDPVGLEVAISADGSVTFRVLTEKTPSLIGDPARTEWQAVGATLKSAKAKRRESPC